MRSLALFICLFLSACGGGTKPPLVATGIIVTEPVPGRSMSAAYLSLANNSDEMISISRVTSPEFGSVEMHESLLENGIAKMRRIEELTIPAHSSVLFERGGKHLMLMRPSGTPNTVSLSFYSGDTLLLSVSAAVTRANN